MSGNINTTDVAAGQNQKEVTINDNQAKTDAFVSEIYTIDLSAGNATLTAAQYRGAEHFKTSGNSVSRSVTLPAVKRPASFENGGSHAVDLIKGSTTISVAAGEIIAIRTDGTTNGLVKKGSSVAASGLVFTDLGDVPGSYSGQASKVVSVKGDESGLEFTSGGGGGGTHTVISTQTASGSSTIDFTGLSSTYKRYEIWITDIVAASSAPPLMLRCGTGGGPTWDTGSNYEWANTSSRSGAASPHGTGNTSDTAIQLGESGISSTSAHNSSLRVIIWNPTSSLYKNVSGEATGYTGSGFANIGSFGGTYRSATAVTAIRLFLASGNIASGTFVLVGVSF